ncbi:MAG: enoyl-[acyl-carrier-protein] reductase FabV, partial [Bacilli bacterium]|nr:enoyl-[acyl-carrier-protein] reductase FabV [Bacilli bacterium]
MIIKPKVRGYICTTAHPAGCARQVQDQIDYVKSMPRIHGPKKVLVIGASTGFGLASRITASFGAGADTIGVFFERPAADDRTASAGWYNTAAFQKAAREAGYFAQSINGDAFSNEIKQQTIALIKKELGQVDLVIYSLASPRRTHPTSGLTFSSEIKPIHAPFNEKTVHTQTGTISEITVEPATEEEIQSTVQVMGGEDWAMWIDAMQSENVLAPGATTVAYSYIGPELTYAIYREGTIGLAKQHLENTAHEIDQRMQKLGGRALISVNKALVTQSSSAIPVVPLYISILFKIMKEKGIHEGTIEQMHRLFAGRLYTGEQLTLDDKGRIRIDDLEMREDVQREVAVLWPKINTDNVESLTDLNGYRAEFLR